MEKHEFKERINYIETAGTPKILVGAMVNIPGVFQAKDEEELLKKAKAFGEMWVKFTKEWLDKEEPFELRKMTEKEWEAREDNITHWEIERVKRIIQRTEVQQRWIQIMVDAGIDITRADDLMDALINDDHKY
jgi:hypothetical protein